MTDISLKWFFQIPGLFITIGVVLILISLLILIIGNSRARSKKKKDEVEEAVNETIPDPVANPNETVRVAESVSTSINMATPVQNNNVTPPIGEVTNNNGSINDNQVNSINTSSVGVNENILPINETGASVVTPVNINNTAVDNGSLANTIPNVNPLNNVTLASGANSGLENVTVAPVSDPNAVTNGNVEGSLNSVSIGAASINEQSGVQPVETRQDVIPSIVNPSVQGVSNPLDNVTPIEVAPTTLDNASNIGTNDLINPVNSVNASIETDKVQLGGNPIEGTTIIPVVNPSINPTGETSGSVVNENDVEEII